MRVFRVARLFRLVNKYKGLSALINTMSFSLPQILNILALLMLVYFIFAVLGTYLFYNVRQGMVINEITNFSNFGYTMLILIRTSTGEDWNYIMYDISKTSSDNC